MRLIVALCLGLVGCSGTGGDNGTVFLSPQEALTWLLAPDDVAKVDLYRRDLQRNTINDIGSLSSPDQGFVRGTLFPVDPKQEALDAIEDVFGELPPTSYRIAVAELARAGFGAAPAGTTPQAAVGVTIEGQPHSGFSDTNIGAGHVGARWVYSFEGESHSWQRMVRRDPTNQFQEVETKAFGLLAADFSTLVALIPVDEAPASTAATWSDFWRDAAGNETTVLSTTVELPDIPRFPTDGVASGDCTLADFDVCLGGDRFGVDVSAVRGGQPVVLTAAVDPGNPFGLTADEIGLLAELLNGCPISDSFWFYGAVATDVSVTLTVTDTVTDEDNTWTFSGLGQPAPAILDTQAFATCP